MYVCTVLHVYVVHEPLGLELQVVVSRYVG